MFAKIVDLFTSKGFISTSRFENVRCLLWQETQRTLQILEVFCTKETLRVVHEFSCVYVFSILRSSVCFFLKLREVSLESSCLFGNFWNPVVTCFFTLSLRVTLFKDLMWTVLQKCTTFIVFSTINSKGLLFVLGVTPENKKSKTVTLNLIHVMGKPEISWNWIF